MSLATALFPDFALILLGFLLMRFTDWGTAFWAGMEKIVYFILFPALLFYSTARSQLDFGTTGQMLQIALFVVLTGVALGWLAKPLFRAGPMLFESGVQTAFRFNSYVGLAVASRLGGEEGTSLMAVIIGFAVPLCNIAAVHALAKKGTGLLREMVRNPLILATGSGLIFNLLGFSFPEFVGATLSRLGNASLALGLIAVGAGLRLSALTEGRALGAWFLGVKLIALPLVGYLLGRWIGLPTLQMQVLLTFCALPAASSAYVLTVRMGGNGPFVAFLISAGTLVSLVTLPFWLALTR